MDEKKNCKLLKENKNKLRKNTNTIILELIHLLFVVAPFCPNEEILDR